jgi:hypothetical protein
MRQAPAAAPAPLEMRPEASPGQSDQFGRAAQQGAAQASAMARFATYLFANGYRQIKDLGGGRYACLMQLMFTTAIITGRWGDLDSYDDRWCFHTIEDAVNALDRWDGTGEPTGWHRHPSSGRRVSPKGEEFVEP